MKLLEAAHRLEQLQSLPSRGAWIEIWPLYHSLRRRGVAPLSGGVD